MHTGWKMACLKIYKRFGGYLLKYNKMIPSTKTDIFVAPPQLQSILEAIHDVCGVTVAIVDYGADLEADLDQWQWRTLIVTEEKLFKFSSGRSLGDGVFSR